MFADNTLTPKEATRLCALGSLAQSPMTYSALAMSIRHFISRVIGPTPEIMGHSIELLKYEGLVETAEGSGDEAQLRITDAGSDEMRQLLTANVRATSTALDKLIVALKLRFMHLLGPDDQCVQADMLVDVCERELSRLEDLRQHHAGDAGYLVSWLDHDIGLLETRLAWLTDFRARLYDHS
jgi:DNA-binding PadR family transcriptional regulator